MNHLKPYPVYKELNLPWLESVPEHWDIHRGKYLFQCIDVRSSTGEEELLTVSSNLGVIPRRSANVTMFKAASYVGYKLCWPRDLVINSLWAWARGLGVSRYHGIISSAYGVYRLRLEVDNNSKFIHELVRSSPFQWELQIRSKGIWISRLQLTDEAFLGAPFPLPPLPEQTAIARYLDYMDKRIRRYINAKKKLIALLNEQKQAIIHRAVTRGLDPNVRLKPSGVEWLGDIPEHWEVKKLKHLTRFHNGLAFKPSDWESSGISIIRIQNLNGSDDFNYTTKEGLPSFLRIQQGDLLFSWSGNRGTSFGPYIWNRDFEGYLNQHIFKLDGYSLNRRYFSHLLRAVTRHIEEQTHGIIGLVHITKPELGSILVPIAPTDEQEEIACWIEKQTEQLDFSIMRLQREIALLREYRTRLIADVVTGKLDVREAAANLPEEEEVGEPLEEAELFSANEDAMKNGEEALSGVPDDD